MADQTETSAQDQAVIQLLSDPRGLGFVVGVSVFVDNREPIKPDPDPYSRLTQSHERYNEK